jgi:5'-nucleotidase
MLNRRKFISDAAMVTGSLLIGPSVAKAAALVEQEQTLTILHTNDTHSRIDPFPMDGGRNQGLGGVAARAQLIRNIRNEGNQVLLLDAGDIFQGTPYFNIYKGEPEIRSMTAMGYEGATVGNHDFDAGLENLATQMKAHASFPMIIANYDFSGTPMESLAVPYKIFRKGKIKIGVTGVGIELKGLVPENLSGNTKYLDPVQRANEVAAELKRKNCDLIVCLSHLGYKYSDNKISDLIFGKESENIDLIIGGHTHTFMDKPEVIRNNKGEDVVINQVGWAGIQLGRLDFNFTPGKKKQLMESSPISVSKKS